MADDPCPKDRTGRRLSEGVREAGWHGACKKKGRDDGTATGSLASFVSRRYRTRNEEEERR